MRFVTKADLAGTSRNVRGAAYETTRFLLADDGLGVTVTDVMLFPGDATTYGYDRHVEIAYCLEGEAEVVEAGTDRVVRVTPGMMWIAERGERFDFRALTPMRLICVFTPPFDGHETGFAGDQ